MPLTAAQLTRLVEATYEIVEAEGADAVTLAAVAKRAGLSRSSLYGYFASHDNLIVGVCEDAIGTWCGSDHQLDDGRRRP